VSAKAEPLRVRLLYSYSHKNEKYRDETEKTLSLLRRQGVLDDWSDHSILPGQPISKKLQEQMDKTDIFLFLISRDFLASDECLKEWDYAAKLAQERPNIVCVPVILTPCPWPDLPGAADLKALPKDAKPISSHSDRNIAWQQIYDGLKRVVEAFRTDFSVRPSFRKELAKTQFISQSHVPLDTVFVFPRLTTPVASGNVLDDIVVADAEQLLETSHVLIVGDALSGKTALCRHLFLTLSKVQSPVLHFDLHNAGPRPAATLFAEHYAMQYFGDYSRWSHLSQRLIVMDNLTADPRTLEYVVQATETFDRVIVAVSSEIYYSFYDDKESLASFRRVHLQPLTHTKQEDLIRQRLRVSNTIAAPGKIDATVDELEGRVNSIIMSNRIVPRYPFYVLAILQTYEGFLQTQMEITSHSHCYHVLILSYLAKSGIDLKDDEVNACFNFAEHLAYERFQAHGVGPHADFTEADFEAFVSKYEEEYVIKSSTLRRLRSDPYGILLKNHEAFRDRYMYFFFLGRFLARNSHQHTNEITELVERSYITANYLTLMFTIHHTDDTRILDEILSRTKASLSAATPATLDKVETRMFADLVQAIPARILSENSVAEERKNERDRRDETEELTADNDVDEDDPVEFVNDIYRIMKNNNVLGQILKSKYGVLRRTKLSEVAETVADGGLRLVSLMVGAEDEVRHLAVRIRRSYPEMSLERIERALQFWIFLLTMWNVGKIVGALNGPEIREVIERLVAEKDTPAYDLIGFYLRLETGDDFAKEDLNELKRLMDKHAYPFMRTVLSFRTQEYLNTHRVPVRLAQAVCAALGIKYRARLKDA